MKVSKLGYSIVKDNEQYYFELSDLEYNNKEEVEKVLNSLINLNPINKERNQAVSREKKIIDALKIETKAKNLSFKEIDSRELL